MAWALVLAVSGCGGSDRLATSDSAEDILASYPEAPTGARRWSYETTLTLGVDDGRALGTVFQLTTATGQLLAAAGFVHGMQTTASNDGRTLNFFMGGNDNAATQFSAVSAPTIATQPFGAGDLFLLASFRAELLAYRYHQPGIVRKWSGDKQQWMDYRHPAVVHAAVASVRNLQTVDNRLLVVYDDAVWYDNRPVELAPLGLDTLLIISMAEYVSGVFHFSVVNASSGGDIEAALVSCLWTPADRLLKDCVASAPPMAPGDSTLNHLPSGLHGTSQGTLLTYGLQGDLFDLDGTEWTPLRAANPAESWQAYASLDTGDDVLLGHYPTGNLFELSRATGTGAWVLAEQHPAVVEPGDVRRDEAQSLMHFGGDFLVGVWPWGEIFRGRPGEPWQPFIQAFSRSGGEPDAGHPFESLIGNNCLGQRIFQILPWQTGFVFNTTIKNNDEECLTAINSITPQQRLEYGQVRFVERNHALACPFVWVSRPTKLVMALGNDNRLFVSQDGRLLCSAPFAGDALAQQLARVDNILAVGGPLQAGAARPTGLFGPLVH